MSEYRIGNAIVIVHRPSLTAEEQAKRENAILASLQQYGKAMKESNT